MKIQKFSHAARDARARIVERALNAMPGEPADDAAERLSNLLLLVLSHVETPEFALHRDYVPRMVADDFAAAGKVRMIDALAALRDALVGFVREFEPAPPKERKRLETLALDLFREAESDALRAYAEALGEHYRRRFEARAREILAVLSAFDFPVLVIGTNFKLLHANREAERFLGVSTELHRGETVSERRALAHLPELSELFERSARTAEKFRTPPTRCLVPSGNLELAFDVYPFYEDTRPAGWVLALPARGRKPASASPRVAAVAPEQGRKKTSPEKYASRSEAPESPSAMDERFGVLVRRLRKAHDMTIAQLADRVGVSRGYFSNIERSVVKPSMRVIENIAAVLDPDGEEDVLMQGTIEKAPAKVRDRLASDGF